MKNKYVFILLIFVLLMGMFGACTREGAQKPINNRQLRDAQMREMPNSVVPAENKDTEKRVIEKINNIPEVEAANVILNGSDAYVAVRLKNGVNNSVKLNLLEREIRNMVKREVPKVANIYFSAAEGTVDRLREYKDENIRNGRVIPEIESIFKSPIRNMTVPGPNM